MTRRRLLSCALTIPCLRLQATGKAEEPFVVIVHPSNRFDGLSRAKISYLFLRRVSRWPWGAEVVPVDLSTHNKLRQAFVAQVLKTSEEELDAYWIDQRTTRGVSPPVQVHDARSIKTLVAERPGAIGFIPVEALDGTVKALKVEP